MLFSPEIKNWNVYIMIILFTHTKKGGSKRYMQELGFKKN